MSIPPVWPLFRPCVQRFIKTTTSHSRSKGYKQNYPQSSATGATSGIPPPRVTTTVSIASNTGAPVSPSTKVHISKYGEVIEEPVDSHFDEERTAVSHGDDGDESRRSLGMVNNIRNSKKLQEGWMELNDLKDDGQKK